MGTQRVTNQTVHNPQMLRKLLEAMDTEIDQVRALINELRTDHGTFKATVDSARSRLLYCMLTAAGLAIKAGGSTLVKAGNDCYAMVDGIRKIAADTDMAALSGTVTNGRHNVYAFFVDNTGNLTSAMGTEGLNPRYIDFPAVPENAACIGFVLINPTGTGDFVGGTTPLDDGTVIPNAVYVDLTAAIDPGAPAGPETIAASAVSEYVEHGS